MAELEVPREAEGAYHYRLIARALAEIDAGGADMPLEALAARLGMSAAHFQRTFSRWVGVSPKRYRQYLSMGLARRLLLDSAGVTEAAAGAGLSGAGRLHDLCLRWEAMTPGEIARGGAGLALRHGWFDSPFGEVLAMASEKGLSGLAFVAERGREESFADLAARWPVARHVADPAAVAPLVAAAFGGGGGTELVMHGAPFQIQVWQALLAVPTGHVVRYADIAEAIGRPQAVRAVGGAIGRNPVAWLIPCHRVIRGDGGLGGYRWGLPVKRAMLAWEAARAEAGGGRDPRARM
jgi:AraC family transcriptional regulator, regulatory protein of adaptative response / methylated-DNA-[protein]-cysteine methyltransferase